MPWPEQLCVVEMAVLREEWQIGRMPRTGDVSAAAARSSGGEGWEEEDEDEAGLGRGGAERGASVWGWVRRERWGVEGRVESPYGLAVRFLFGVDGGMRTIVLVRCLDARAIALMAKFRSCILLGSLSPSSSCPYISCAPCVYIGGRMLMKGMGVDERLDSDTPRIFYFHACHCMCPKSR